jgi:ribosomal protein S18 acetylase RimI-like enzyme
MHLLDRPVWSALTTRQSAFGEGSALAKRYPADISPLAAARDASGEALAALRALIPSLGDISLLEAEPPAPPPGVSETVRKTCVQMLQTHPVETGAQAQTLNIQILGDADAPEMLALALMTRPGPFCANTHTLGRFIGVRDKGALIAMAGERTQVENAAGSFVEVSAVCTHPAYRGQGLGAALLARVAARIRADGATPYLHSYADNAPALALYRQLGFTVRADIVHCVWKRR